MLTLKAKIRKITGKKVRTLRDKDIIPAVVYGHGFKSKPIQVLYSEFEKVYKEAGESSLINLDVSKEKPVKALIYDIQLHPLTDKIQHIDFYKVKAGEKIRVEVALKFMGISPAVKELSGTLISNLDKIEVECLPEDLIHEIEVDISNLASFDEVVRIKDLNIPEKVKTLHDPEDIVVHVEPPRKAEELAEEEAAEKPEEEEAEKVEGEEAEKKAEEVQEGEEQAKQGKENTKEKQK